MSVTISFTSLFSDRIDGIGTVELEGSTVSQVLEALTERFPALAPLVWSAASTPNPVMVLFLNETQLSSEVLDVRVRPGDEITIVPAIEGG